LFKDLFKKTKYITLPQETMVGSQKKAFETTSQKPAIPDGAWIKCEKCGKTFYKKDIEENISLCLNCDFHFRIGAKERIRITIDEDSFVEFDSGVLSDNPLDFPKYNEKITSLMEKTGLNEAVITGTGLINQNQAVICVMDGSFIMGSMGSVVGEKITRAIEKSIELRLPLIIFTTSGGARMQEGIFSLMQMAKTSAALARHNQEGLLYITVLTDPTTAGVSASFGMLGDIILSEPEALIGFAGPRVIEQTIRQILPEGFQRAEFLLEHGFIDKVVNRKELKETLSTILSLHKGV